MNETTQLEATIESEHSTRYLARFCTHAASMGRRRDHRPRLHPEGPPESRPVRVSADWSDGRGTVTFEPWGRCSMAASESSLTVRIDAADEEGLRRIQRIVTDDLSRLGG
ncbi:MAG: DUF2218 domain-containing protein, partial [Candidatus Dormibacteraeota bacterium]|nr:DUF2218 domain-containing protein [Candidatus Dormibacteraeota bacterium]